MSITVKAKTPEELRDHLVTWNEQMASYARADMMKAVRINARKTAETKAAVYDAMANYLRRLIIIS